MTQFSRFTPSPDSCNGAPSLSQWRTESAPVDFAARVMAQALLAAPEPDVCSRVSVAKTPWFRAWARQVGVGVALALGASFAAAAVSFSRHPVEFAEYEPEPASPQLRSQSVVADLLVDTVRSERIVSEPSVARAKRTMRTSRVTSEMVPADPSVTAPEFPLLPPHLHVPPCQCTLRAVLCSCVE